jgi:hypothetical protein
MAAIGGGAYIMAIYGAIMPGGGGGGGGILLLLSSSAYLSFSFLAFSSLSID